MALLSLTMASGSGIYFLPLFCLFLWAGSWSVYCDIYFKRFICKTQQLAHLCPDPVLGSSVSWQDQWLHVKHCRWYPMDSLHFCLFKRESYVASRQWGPDELWVDLRFAVTLLPLLPKDCESTTVIVAILKEVLFQFCGQFNVSWWSENHIGWSTLL